ncbi:DUF4345 domain-containing protein [Streptomyces sp. NPDC059176]|uniref:DUF4345 domain-containing protein n=1 Tax=unclassified Streptomyces TaxID=2593676 RepID=UPI00368CB206
MSSRRTFQGVLALLGVVVLCTGAPDVVAGPAALPGDLDVSTTLDSNYRFFAGVWCALGIALLAAARQPEGHGALVRVVFGAVFLGGSTRAVSYFAVGAPHAVYASFIAVELILPPALMLWYGRVVKRESRTAPPA